MNQAICLSAILVACGRWIFETVYLVDTNVISAGAARKARAPAGLLDWMERHSEELYLSVITVAEVEDGIAKARREGAVLASWLETVLHLYGARILPVDVVVARALGGLSDVARGRGLLIWRLRRRRRFLDVRC